MWKLSTFYQEKALVGAFSVIVKTDCETNGAVHRTRNDTYIQLSSDFSAQAEVRQTVKRMASCALLRCGAMFQQFQIQFQFFYVGL